MNARTTVAPGDAIALTPDRAALAAFSAAVFKNADPQGFVSLRGFKDNGKRGEPAVIIEPITIGNPSYPDIVFERALQAATWNEPVVFCPPVVTFCSGKNATVDNIKEGVAISVDFDASPVEGRSVLESILGKPTIVVASGGEWPNPETGEIERKCHAHWRIKVPTKTTAEHLLLREARALAIDLVGADPTSKPLVHPLRWPGSWHRKGQPKLTEIIELNDDVEIDLHEALAALREMSGRSESPSAKTPGGILAALRVQLASNPEHVALALREIPNNDLSRAEWNQMGMAIWGATGGSDVGLKAFEEWSAKAPNKCHGPDAAQARWKHFATSPPTKIGYGTLVYLARQNKPGWTAVAPTGEPDWRERKVNGKPVPSFKNAMLALTALGIECKYDVFHDKTLVGYAGDVKHELQSVVGEVSDSTILALRGIMLDRFDFDLSERHTRDAVMALADKNRFNPVCDLIDEAEGKWDGVKRLDRAAADYFNCEDTPLNSACMRKALIAMVKRARHPGCKFDTIVVLESEEGFNKSSAWQALAGDENFSDERIIGAAGREVQEQLSGIWVHENADLAGMKKTDVESVKAYASRSIDRARPAYGRFLKKQPRHSIEVGTTNDSEYLQSQTGNRRFWPMVVVKSIDVEKLRRDRLQLIGEAACYESKGESVVLHEDLWGAAGIQQEQRRVTDPWEDALRVIHKQSLQRVLSNGDWIEKSVDIVHYSFFGDDEIETVSVPALLEHVLNVPISQQRSDHTMRLSRTMKRLGWQRNTNGYVSINGKRVRGYFRKRTHLSEAFRDWTPSAPRSHKAYPFNT